jgi:hypothetical protein
MPQMSGPEPDDSVVRHGVLEDGVTYLQKPITPGSLAKKVRTVLDGDAMSKPTTFPVNLDEK